DERAQDGAGGTTGHTDSSTSACDTYGESDLQHCTPRTKLNEQDPQELHNVTGASVDRAWEVTTGRPDVVIGVVDSGVEWDSADDMRDLNNATWLNTGELPEPQWGTRDADHPYDRDANGRVDLRDWCPDWEDVADCGGTGDPTVRGAAGTDDTDLNANGLLDPEDLIFLFSDGVDGDGNGYTDDIAGWDTYEDDNDPFDEHAYGHGTGEAKDSVAEGNNGGVVGTCPDCRVMHLRVGDSFIADVNDFAQAVLFATDTGATVVQSALGTLNNSRFAQEAIDYAYRRGVVLIASAADESAGHHNQPSVLEHATVFNAIGEPQVPASASGSYLQFRGCTNYGAYITAAVPANSCSSEAVGRAAGMAGLAYAAARNAVDGGRLDDYGVLDGAGGVPAGNALSAEEVKQLIVTTADDIDNLTPVNKEADVDVPGSQRYPAGDGWDPFFGHGRINARTIVERVDSGAVPPEADISSPRWYQTLPTTEPIRVGGAVAARRAEGYRVRVRWAPWSWRDTNSAPAYTTEGVTLVKSSGTDPYSGTLATIDPAVVKAALDAADTSAPGLGKGTRGPAVDPLTGRGDKENRNLPDKFGVIVELEVVALDAAGEPVEGPDGGRLVGRAVKNMNLHDDPALLPGFPKRLHGDGAAPPRFADLDDDGVDELVVATSNGEVHAYRADGTELPGWPVLTTALSGDYTRSAAYRSGEITQPGGAVRSATLRSPAIGDLDRDGDLEVVVPDFAGRVTAFDGDGTVLPGFPVRTDPRFSTPQPADRAAGFYEDHPGASPGRYPRTGQALPNDPALVPDLVNRRTKNNRTHWWVMAAPTLGDIDPASPGLEIVVGAADRHAYAWRSDGTPVPGWPVLLRDPEKVASVDPVTREITQPDGVRVYNGAKVVTSPSIGDLDGDGRPEVVVAPNEQYAEPPNSDDPLFSATSLVLTPGNQRLYAVHADGALHGGGAPAAANGFPNANAFLPGWPYRLSTATLELLPVVGNGPTGAPSLGDVVPGGGLEVAAFGTAGPVHVVDGAGQSVYGRSGDRDRTLLTAGAGPLANSKDAPSIPAVGGTILLDLDDDGALDVAAPAAGAGKLVDLALPDDQLLSDNQLAVWHARQDGTRSQHAAFPREVNDLQFLATPSAVDVDGDGSDEVLAGTAYSDLHAFSASGDEPGLRTLDDRGWPKFTGGWTVVAAAAGSLTGDGSREIASTTREGDLFVWSTPAHACDPASWREYGHDGWNSGNATTDALRPARPIDLEARTSGGGATITLTAVGDDGRCGTAAVYDVRTSASPVTPETFDRATPATGEPAPAGAGAAESFDITLPAGHRYVALRVLDADPATATQAAPANPSALAVVRLDAGPAPRPGARPDTATTRASALPRTGGPLLLAPAGLVLLAAAFAVRRRRVP
ncbi:MAG TPA: S8 family serine peptidase, partial [Mycobacteriales bacterium]|nr:S8 family serine peptidase [Mycobacteriales bacterium]